MSVEKLDRRRAVISKALSGEAGRALLDLLMEDFVNVDLMQPTDRETVEAVAKHDLVMYLRDMGKADG